MGKISPPPGPSVAGWAREGCPRVLPSPSGLGSHPGASWEQGLHVGGKGFCGAGARHKGSAWVSPGQAAAQRQALRPRGELSSGTLDAPLKGMPTRGQAPVAWGPHGPLRLPGAELRVANFRPVGRRLSPTPQLPKRHRLLGVVPSTWSPKTCQDGEGWWQHKALRPQVRAITCGGQSRTTQPRGGEGGRAPVNLSVHLRPSPRLVQLNVLQSAQGSLRPLREPQPSRALLRTPQNPGPQMERK